MENRSLNLGPLVEFDEEREQCSRGAMFLALLVVVFYGVAIGGIVGFIIGRLSQ